MGGVLPPGLVQYCSQHSVHDTKQFDGEGPVMFVLWGMQSTPSLPSLPGPLWPGVVVPDRVLFTGQIELFDA